MPGSVWVGAGGSLVVSGSIGKFLENVRGRQVLFGGFVNSGLNFCCFDQFGKKNVSKAFLRYGKSCASACGKGEKDYHWCWVGWHLEDVNLYFLAPQRCNFILSYK